MSKDRFDLEQEIMDCWRIVDDLKTLTTGILDSDMSVDKVANILIGLENLYTLRFKSLFEVFEECVRNKEV